MIITLEELKQKYIELGAMIKSFEKQQEEAEFPKDGDKCWRILSWGDVDKVNYRTGDSIYEDMLSIGNCFRTKEDAEFAVECLKVLADLKRCGGVWKTKIDSETLYLLIFSYDNGIYVENWKARDVIPTMCFSTEAQAQEALNTIGEERLLKYWFCVEVEA